MICTHCGNQLPDGTRFCVFCGTAQESQPVAAPAPVEETPVVPAEETPVQSSLAEDSFINAVAVEETTYETPFAAPEFTPSRTPAPKKKKTGVIIAIVLILVLLAGAAVGVYFWLDYQKTTAYEDATAMLEAGDISGALSAFEDLGDYEDSAKMVKNLKKYQQAVKKMEAHEYDEAKALFEALGKFHDSKIYVESGVDYHQATYLMDSAQNDKSIDLYCSAAEIFEALGEYEDSAKLASTCWYEAGMLELENGNNDAALDLVENCNDEDAAALQAAIESASADAAMLVSLENALVIWLDSDEKYTREEKLQKAYECLEAYEDAFFLDSRLEELYGDIMDSLETQMEAMDSEDEVEDWVMMYEGMAEMYKVCDTLYEEYGFLKNTQWEEVFIGNSETIAQYALIEKSLVEQLNGITAPYDEEKDYFYAPYTNDTGIDFTLTVYIEFYKGGEHMENGDELVIEVPAGAEVQIPLIPKTVKIEELDGWTAVWSTELN